MKEKNIPTLNYNFAVEIKIMRQIFHLIIIFSISFDFHKHKDCLSKFLIPK